MKIQGLKLLFLLTSVIFFLFLSLIVPRYLFATSGCCSWHGGQSYCDYSTGRWVCADGTYSPSCTCGGGYVPPPTCPLFSSYNSITEQCECYSGYIASGNQCISRDQACRDQLGYSSRYNSLTGNCECMYGYIISGGKCTYGTTFCQNKYGYSSTYDNINNTCKCNYGYRFNSTGTRCISDDEACQEEYGFNSKATLGGDKCECKYGYVWQGNSCVWDTSSYESSNYTDYSAFSTSTPTLKATVVPKKTSTPAPSPIVKGVSSETTPMPTPSPAIEPLTAGEKAITLGVLAVIIGLPVWVITKIVKKFRKPKVEI
jgi:hypothetical protein